MRRDYPNLLPSRPRIVDPPNPANNVWITGVGRYQPRSDYELQDGNTARLKSLIHTIDLSKSL